jgi:hypothetical protein
LDVDTLLCARAVGLLQFFQYTTCLSSRRILSLAVRKESHISPYMSDFFLDYENLVKYISQCRILDKFTSAILEGTKPPKDRKPVGKQ